MNAQPETQTQGQQLLAQLFKVYLPSQRQAEKITTKIQTELLTQNSLDCLLQACEKTGVEQTLNQLPAELAIRNAGNAQVAYVEYNIVNKGFMGIGKTVEATYVIVGTAKDVLTAQNAITSDPKAKIIESRAVTNATYLFETKGMRTGLTESAKRLIANYSGKADGISGDYQQAERRHECRPNTATLDCYFKGPVKKIIEFQKVVRGIVFPGKFTTEKMVFE